MTINLLTDGSGGQDYGAAATLADYAPASVAPAIDLGSLASGAQSLITSAAGLYGTILGGQSQLASLQAQGQIQAGAIDVAKINASASQSIAQIQAASAVQRAQAAAGGGLFGGVSSAVSTGSDKLMLLCAVGGLLFAFLQYQKGH